MRNNIADSCLLFLCCCLFTFSGCDKVNSVVDDVKASVNGNEPASAPASPAATPAPIAVPAQAPPSPQELIAEFRSLQPYQINDGALARVASQPEAAAEITAIEIQNAQLTQAGIASLKAMENLTILSLHGPSMQPLALSLLGQLTSLKSLDISGTMANDEVVGNLATLENLESLNLSGTPITPAAGAPLSRLISLRVLKLAKTAVDDSTVAAIQRLPLQELDLMQTPISSNSIPTIMEMKSLEDLNVAFTGVVGAAFKGFGSASLKRLNVGETNFGGEGLLAIKGMKSLEELNIFRAGLVEHKALANIFKSFPHLKILNSGGNPITNAGMEVFFKGHDTLEEIRLAECKGISDAGLSYLMTVKTLKYIDVHNTGCTGNGGRALKQKLPDCRIVTSEGEF